MKVLRFSWMLCSRFLMQFKLPLLWDFFLTNLRKQRWIKLSIRVRHTKLISFRPDRQMRVWKIVQRTQLCSFPALCIEFYWKSAWIKWLESNLRILTPNFPALGFIFFSSTCTFLRLMKSIATHAFPSRSISSHSNFSSFFLNKKIISIISQIFISFGRCRQLLPLTLTSILIWLFWWLSVSHST